MSEQLKHITTMEDLQLVIPTIAKATAMQIASTAEEFDLKWNGNKNSMYTLMKVSSLVLGFDKANVLADINQVPPNLRSKGYMTGKTTEIARKYAHGMMFRYKQNHKGTDTRFNDVQFIQTQLEVTNRNDSKERLDIVVRMFLQSVQEDFLTVFIDEVLNLVRELLFKDSIYTTPEQLDILNMAIVDNFGVAWIKVFEGELKTQRLAYSSSNDSVAVHFPIEVARMATELHRFYMEDVHTEYAMFQSKILVTKLSDFKFDLVPEKGIKA